jgi:drug/metabolite transporter (DMT)-like permease
VKFRDTTRGIQPPEWAVWATLAVFGVFAFALWWWVQSLVSDPLDLMGLTFVQVGAVVFGVPMLLGRGTARGQSRVFAWATVLGPGSSGFLFIPYLSPSFAAHPAFFVLVGTTTACAIAFLLLDEHLRRADARKAAVPAEPVAVA